jgi:2',3'-cyclic-nucleotide 2'-phosphodiesterase/3'-nucleotidase
MQWLRLLAVLLVSTVSLPGEKTRIRILVTTDLHGHLLAWDYFSAQPAPRGLAAIATLVRAERAADPEALLVDCGDTIQGSPLESVYQLSRKGAKLPPGGKAPSPEPMIAAMNTLGYDAMIVGNHEFNYGLENLSQAIDQSRFPWLAANVSTTPGRPPFAPYVIRTIRGVKVAIVGLTTPGVPDWEQPENYQGYTFQPGVKAARRVLGELEREHQPDLIVIAAHSGLDRDPQSGRVFEGGVPGENFVWQLALEFPQVEAIAFGHTHRELAGFLAGRARLVQPRNWGMSLGVLEFEMDRGDTRRWEVVKKSSRVVPVRADTPEDPEITKIALPYHQATEIYLNQQVTRTARTLDALHARVEDSALVDLIHRFQLAETKADVSFASAFNLRARIPAGPVTVRQIAALYPYDNSLFVVEGNGRMVREALEQAARYFLPCPGACRTNPDIPGFNFDTAQGVSYEIDLSRPLGDRIRNLRFRGKPLADGQRLRIAVNSYRAGGSGGYSMFRGAKVIWRSSWEIRERLIEYYGTAGRVLPEADGNWRLAPTEAVARLRGWMESESTASAGR